MFISQWISSAMAVTRVPEIKAIEIQVGTSPNSSPRSRVEALDKSHQTDGAESVQKG